MMDSCLAVADQEINSKDSPKFCWLIETEIVNIYNIYIYNFFFSQIQKLGH